MADLLHILNSTFATQISRDRNLSGAGKIVEGVPACSWGKTVRGTVRGSGVEIKAKNLAELGEMQEDKYNPEAVSGPQLGRPAYMLPYYWI